MTPQQGNVYVLSAPSGAGKSTLVRRLLKQVPDLIFSTSFTTRPPREGEVHGREYFFVDDATFDAMLAEGGFVEWVQVYKHRYGTGRAWIQEQRASGKDILLDIETIGAKNVKAALPEAILIFLLPPSGEELVRRLRGRGTETEEQLSVRIEHARHEMEQFSHYEYLVVNEDLETAYRQMESIFMAERSRLVRMKPTAEHILTTF